MDASSTDTSKKSALRTIYESVVFWGIVAMLTDCVLYWFGGSLIGPGYPLGMTLTAYSSAIREEGAGQQYRPRIHSAIFLLLIPYCLIYGLTAWNQFDLGKPTSGAARSIQLTVSVACFFATIHRLKRLPLKPEGV